MAVAIMGGLSIATFLTLGNLPALYVLLFRVKRPTDPQPTPAPRPEANGRAGHAGARAAPVERAKTAHGAHPGAR